MKRWIKTASCLFGICSLMAIMSCTNGGGSDWLGNWQLREYRYPDGSKQRVDSVFYGFQKGSFLTHYMHPSGGFSSIYGYYEEYGDSVKITLWEPPTGNAVYEKWFGWNNGVRKFQVKNQTSDKMELSHNDTLYIFRRY